MDDRERLQWLLEEARRLLPASRPAYPALALLYTFPLLALGLVALARGRPGFTAASLALALITFAILRLIADPPRPRRARTIRLRR